MSEDKIRKAIRASEEAQALLDNKMLKECFSSLRELYTEELLNSRPDEEFKREKLYLAFNLIGKVEQHLHKAISNGSVAKKDLANMLENEKRKKASA